MDTWQSGWNFWHARRFLLRVCSGSCAFAAVNLDLPLTASLTNALQQNFPGRG